MKPIYRGYDLILINGLLEKSYHPAAFLKGVHERLNAGGLLVIACSNHWSTDHTARENWLGGFKDKTGENQTTLEGIRTSLQTHFDLLDASTDLPQALRIDARCYQYRLMQVSVWKLR